MNIPLVDLRRQYETIEAEIDSAIQSVIDDCAFIQGKYVRRFEDSFAEALGARHCIGLGNGTDAIVIALKALGVGPGDEVITAANSFIATSEAITMAGARVVFVDAEPRTYTMDVTQIKEKITPRTKAIVPVHLYGHTADMDPIVSLAREHMLYVVEDAAQAHLAEYRGRVVGAIGNAGCFSFYPGKNLGAYGDAGAIVTNDDGLAKKIRMIANHGRIDKYDHQFEGVNSRMDGIQGSILSIKLKHLPMWTEQRRNIAKFYGEMLGKQTEVIPPVETGYAKHVYHLYVVRTKARHKIQNSLKDKGISTGIHYPIALPNLSAYRYMGHLPSDFPTATQYQDEILSLPMYPELKKRQVEYIVECIKECI